MDAVPPDIKRVNDKSQRPALTLAQHFAQEAKALRLDEMDSPSQAVSDIRRVLDRTASRYARTTDDPMLQRTGQWLIEIVKSGTGLIDRASHADIVWDEVARDPSIRITLRPTLFYGAAGLFALAGFLQGVGLMVWGAATLAGLHAVSTLNVSTLPFMPKQKLLPDHDGSARRASAVMRLDSAGLVAQVSDALNTADHILLRLATPASDTHWSDDPRIMSLLQSLIEAGRTEDSEYALELSRKELPSLIEGAGLKLVDYSKAKAEWFDTLPALGEGPKTQTAAPALVTEDGRVIRRGTVWVRHK